MTALVGTPAVPTNTPRTPGRGRLDLLALLPGLLLATALTAWRFDAKPMWRDEWYTLGTADRPLLDVLHLVSGSQDVGLAGYYSAVHAWLLLGDGTAWLRLPSAVGTLVLVAATVAVARRQAGRAAGVVAGLLAAVAPEVVAHAQEARPYPLVLAGVACTLWSLLRYRERPGPGRAWTVALVAVVPGTLHPIAGLPAVVGMLGAASLRPGLASRREIVAVALPAAVTGSVLVGAALVVAAGQSSGPPPTADDLPLLLTSLTGGRWLAAGTLVAATAGALALRRPGDAVVFDGTTSRGLTYAYLPPGTHVRDTLLAATPLEAGTIYGRDLAGAGARSALAAHDRLWVTGTIGGSGTWNSPRAAAAWERGRVRAEHSTFGRWWLELWVLPALQGRAGRR